MRPLAVVVSTEPFDCAALTIALTRWCVVSVREYEASNELRIRAPHVVIVNAAGCTADPADVVLHSSIARARELFPSTPLLLFAHIGDASSRTLLRAYCWNIAGVMFQGLDDRPGYAEAVVAEARAVWVSRQFGAALPQLTPGWVALVFARVTAHGYGLLDVPTLAHFLAICARALDKRLAQLGLPSALDFIRLGQCLCLVDALATGLWTVTDATRMLGYAQTRTVRRATRKHLACAPKQAATMGGLEHAIACVRTLVEHAMSEHPVAWQRERERERERESSAPVVRAQNPFLAQAA